MGARGGLPPITPKIAVFVLHQIGVGGKILGAKCAKYNTEGAILDKPGVSKNLKNDENGKKYTFKTKKALNLLENISLKYTFFQIL